VGPSRSGHDAVNHDRRARFFSCSRTPCPRPVQAFEKRLRKEAHCQSPPPRSISDCCVRVSGGVLELWLAEPTLVLGARWRLARAFIVQPRAEATIGGDDPGPDAGQRWLPPWHSGVCEPLNTTKTFPFLP